MRKNNNFSKAATLAAMFFVVVMGFVSCSQQTNLDEPEKVEVPVPGPVQYRDRTNTIREIINNVFVARTNKDNVEYLYNNQLVRRASFMPAAKVLYVPSAEQTAPTLEYKGGRWIDSNGMTFTADEQDFPADSLLLNSAVTAEKEMGIFRIHEKVAQVLPNAYDEGMATDQKTGQSGTYKMPLPGTDYFMSDSSVTVITKTEKEIEIQWRDSIVYRDSIRYVDRTEYVMVNREKNLAIVHGFGYGELRFFRDGKTFVYRLDLLKTNVLMDEANWGVATKVSESMEGFNLSDGQIGTYTVEANGVNLESILFVGAGASFTKLNDVFKYGTVTTKVAFSYEEDGESIREEHEVSASYFHEKEAKAEPEVVIPEVTTEYTYTVDSVRNYVKDSEGRIYGQKMKITVTRSDGKKFKKNFLTWETGLISGTWTGTQVNAAEQLKATYWNTPKAYTAEGWSGTDNSTEGFTIEAEALEYQLRTEFPKVEGFGDTKESVAETNIVFGTRTCVFTDPENPSFTFTITPDGVGGKETSIKVIEDQCGFNEAAPAEVDSRGLPYKYIGSHYLSVEQYVGKTLVLTQSREEFLLYPKW